MVNQYDHSIESLSEAVRLAPRNAIVLFNRGNVYARLGFRDQAVQDYAAAEQSNPRLIASYGGSARLLEEMGRQSLAIRDEQRMGSAAGLRRAGRPLREREREADRGATGQGAIAEFDRVLAADPNRAEAYLARGWAKFCGGDAGAEHDARAYLKLKGYRERTSSYMVLLGYLSAKRAGKEEDAQAFLDEAEDEIRGDAWPQPVFRLFRREISATSLLTPRRTRPRRQRPTPSSPSTCSTWATARARSNTSSGSATTACPGRSRPTWRGRRSRGSTRGRRSRGGRRRARPVRLGGSIAAPSRRDPPGWLEWYLARCISRLDGRDVEGILGFTGSAARPGSVTIMGKSDEVRLTRLMMARSLEGVKSMRAENLDEVIRAQPFRPFSLRLADGSVVEVRHPEWIAHPAGTRTAVVVRPDESVKILDVARVLSVELGPPQPAGAVAENPNGGE